MIITWLLGQAPSMAGLLGQLGMLAVGAVLLSSATLRWASDAVTR